MKSRRCLAALTAAVALCSGCAIFNPDNTPTLNFVEEKLLPERKPTRFFAYPLVLPVALGAVTIDALVVRPIEVADDAWGDTKDVLWEDFDWDTEYVTECASLPLRAALTPVVLTVSFLARWTLDIEPRGGEARFRESERPPPGAKPPEVGQPETVNKVAEEVVRAFCDHMRELGTFQCDLTTGVTLSGKGMRAELTTEYVLALERPNRFAIRMVDGFVGATIVSDGERTYTYLPMFDRYTVAGADEEFSVLVAEEHAASLMVLGQIGLWMLKVLFMADPYEAIMLDVKEVRYMGEEAVDGRLCHRVEVLRHEFNWGIWISTGERPLAKQIAFSQPESGVHVPHAPGAGESEMERHVVFRFSNWKTDVNLPTEVFSFTPPSGAERAESSTGDLPLCDPGSQTAVVEDENQARVTKNAVKMPVGRYFLLRRGDEYGAVQILQETADDGAVYKWYYQGDGSGDLTKENVQHGRGKVYERYERRKTGEHEYYVTDIGSKLTIECGPLAVGWSMSTWIYLSGDIEIALTEAISIEEVDVSEESLNWLPRRHEE